MKFTEQIPKSQYSGFMLIGIILLIAVVSIPATLATQQLGFMHKRDRQIQVLVAGRSIAAALSEFAYATPGAQPKFPQALEDLLQDRRVVGVKRYLRKIPLNPYSGKADWHVQRNSAGDIEAVYVVSHEAPMLKTGFTDVEFDFSEAKEVGEWKFRARRRQRD